ncbi:MAG: hypothetical protein H7311_08225 [Ramlibacter sp.]|nr:hypothetical protein [Cryobacterium sp.]
MADESNSMRAQLLATEHWSLLASRGTTQTEVLTRIAIFLTLVSAGLVSLALVGQATKFSETFSVFAVAVLGIVVLVGVLTQLRVMNVSMEDLIYVIAMNRLRAAYTELDPGIDRYLTASRFDDQAGVEHTYYFLGPRRGPSQVLASSMVFIMAVNATLVGLLMAAISIALDTPITVTVLTGAGCGPIFLPFPCGAAEGRTSRSGVHTHPASPSPGSRKGRPRPSDSPAAVLARVLAMAIPAPANG